MLNPSSLGRHVFNCFIFQEHRWEYSVSFPSASDLLKSKCDVLLILFSAPASFHHLVLSPCTSHISYFCWLYERKVLFSVGTNRIHVVIKNGGRYGYCGCSRSPLSHSRDQSVVETSRITALIRRFVFGAQGEQLLRYIACAGKWRFGSTQLTLLNCSGHSKGSVVEHPPLGAVSGLILHLCEITGDRNWALLCSEVALIVVLLVA